MKKNIIIIVLSVVALLLAGTVGYLIAEKVVSSKYENGSMDIDNNDNNIEGESKELELNSLLVTSLIYPKNIIKNLGYKGHWIYKNETIDTLGRSRMMYNAAYEEGLGREVYFAYNIKTNFIKIFGPDTSYYDGDIEQVESCLISKYDAATNTYTANSGCGGAMDGSFIDSVSKKYKAEQDGDYIYVYEYVQSVFITRKDKNDWESPTVVYLLGKEATISEVLNSNYESKYEILSGTDEANYENVIEQMMNKGEVDTYKWTFKKQSDGKYYFYSGAWEN